MCLRPPPLAATAADRDADRVPFAPRRHVSHSAALSETFCDTLSESPRWLRPPGKNLAATLSETSSVSALAGHAPGLRVGFRTEARARTRHRQGLQENLRRGRSPAAPGATQTAAPSGCLRQQQCPWRPAISPRRISPCWTHPAPVAGEFRHRGRVSDRVSDRDSDRVGRRCPGGATLTVRPARPPREAVHWCPVRLTGTPTGTSPRRQTASRGG